MQFEIDRDRFTLSLLSWLLVSTSAKAEVTLVEKDGWTFFADGRINASSASGKADGFPEPILRRGSTSTGRTVPPLESDVLPLRKRGRLDGEGADDGKTDGKLFTIA